MRKLLMRCVRMLPSLMCHWRGKGDSALIGMRANRVTETRVHSAYNLPVTRAPHPHDVTIVEGNGKSRS